MSTKEEKKRKKATRKDNGEGSIFLRKDGRWVAKIQTDGKVKSFYAKTQTEVKKKLKDYKKLLENNINTNYQDIYFDEYIMKWLKSVKSIKLKGNSYDRLYDTINTNVLPYLKTIRLKELTSDDIQNMISELMKKPSKVYKNKTMSYSSIKKAYEAVNGCLKYALEQKHILYNPCTTVELPNQDNFEKKNINIFTDEEVEKIIKTSEMQYTTGRIIYPTGVSVIILFNTGIRTGELLALKWNDVDFDNKIIHINKNVSITSNKKYDKENKKHGKYEVLFKNTPKTKSSNRMIPINNNCLYALNKLKENYPNSEFVVPSSKNTVTYPDTFKRMFNSILKRANVPIYGVHSTRHTFASKLFKEKVDIKIISKLLGHSSVSITYNTYIHIIQQQEANAIDILDKLNWS